MELIINLLKNDLIAIPASLLGILLTVQYIYGHIKNGNKDGNMIAKIVICLAIGIFLKSYSSSKEFRNMVDKNIPKVEMSKK